jgi:pentatricopeptide repeat protein
MRGITLSQAEALNGPWWWLSSGTRCCRRLKSPCGEVLLDDAWLPCLGEMVPGRNASRIVDNVVRQYVKNGLFPSFWLLVDGLKYRQSPKLFTALEENSISRVWYRSWIQCQNADNTLKTLGISTDDPSRFLKDAHPLFQQAVLFHAMNDRVKTKSQSKALLDLVLNQLPHVKRDLQPPLLVLATLMLWKFNMLAFVRRVVETFLALHLPRKALHFNLLLQSISRFPSSDESSRLALELLHAMKSRKVELLPRTYSHLLSDEFITLQLAKYLWKLVELNQFSPDEINLHSFLRIFAKNRLRVSVKQCMHLLREKASIETPGNVPLGPRLRPRDKTLGGAIHASHTMRLLSFRNSEFASLYFGRLLAAARRLASRKHQTSKLLRRGRTLPRWTVQRKEFVDASDLTSLLTIVARDTKVDGQTLVRLFQLISGRICPSIASYTVVIRGLLHRNQIPLALQVFDRMMNRFELDQEALAVGLRVFAQNMTVHHAFDLLEAYFAPNLDPVPVRRRELGIVALNEFLSSLAKHKRPDLVFAIWDYLGVLYRLRPDVVTLNTLLFSAIAASHCTLTFQGALAQIKSIIWTTPEPIVPLGREAVVALIKGKVVDNDGDPITEMTENGMWRDVPAWQVVVSIFKKVMLGNWPELRHVRPPAHAVRRSMDSSPMGELIRSLSRSPADPSLSLIPTELVTECEYPDIVPDDETFFRYICICGTHELSSHIPLVLAWMRALNVEPSKGTLTVSILFWSEVSLQAPLVERWVGESRSEFGKLISWLMDWVGEERMPTQLDTVNWLGKLRKMREEPMKFGLRIRRKTR